MSRISSSLQVDAGFPVRMPLYHEDFPFVVMWSEKAGCTGIVKWFFLQLGLLEDALNYHPWVHNYENDKFKSRHGYLAECLKAIERGKPVMKFVRNPYRRAFSCYLELCNPKIADPGPHWTKAYRRRVLAYLLGYDESIEYGFSFRQYMNWLMAQPAASLDAHIRPQFMEVESGLDVRVHQIEQGRDGMKALEAEFGLIDSSQRKDVFTSDHHHSKLTLAPRPAVSVFDLSIPVRRSKAFRVIEPTLEEYTGSDVGAMIRQFYADDFIRYGYEM